MEIVPCCPDTQEQEEWREIPQFPRYEASNLGNIRNKKTKRVMSPCNNNGYLALGINTGTYRSHQRVHRLVAMAFCPNLLNKPAVNHKDSNPRNNRADNLEWVTNSENLIHYFKTHKRKTKIPIRITDFNGGIREFSGVNEAGRAYGLARATIWGYAKSGGFWGGTIERIEPNE